MTSGIYPRLLVTFFVFTLYIMAAETLQEIRNNIGRFYDYETSIGGPSSPGQNEPCLGVQFQCRDSKFQGSTCIHSRNTNFIKIGPDNRELERNKHTNI
jgi:hypothetical protein